MLSMCCTHLDSAGIPDIPLRTLYNTLRFNGYVHTKKFFQSSFSKSPITFIPLRKTREDDSDIPRKKVSCITISIMLFGMFVCIATPLLLFTYLGKFCWIQYWNKNQNFCQNVLDYISNEAQKNPEALRTQYIQKTSKLLTSSSKPTPEQLAGNSWVTPEQLQSNSR